eukprot:TRINITY_DN2078_c1_g1_i1.p2 TRINITY_DN2078_c1_g1~~TRINITY_DN2078_c1_g1_i1.p2  ORF type:complete len:127 (+),score=37.67 TRINITY_DN2078_c1_g1_i1:459-839(+)
MAKNAPVVTSSSPRIRLIDSSRQRSSSTPPRRTTSPSPSPSPSPVTSTSNSPKTPKMERVFAPLPDAKTPPLLSISTSSSPPRSIHKTKAKKVLIKSIENVGESPKNKRRITTKTNKKSNSFDGLE